MVINLSGLLFCGLCPQAYLFRGDNAKGSVQLPFNMEFINSLEAPLYVSLDIDVLDPAFAPGISHHEPGGMTTRQLIDIIQQISVPIVGADIVELNPKRDINNVTAMVA